MKSTLKYTWDSIYKKDKLCDFTNFLAYIKCPKTKRWDRGCFSPNHVICSCGVEFCNPVVDRNSPHLKNRHPLYYKYLDPCSIDFCNVDANGYLLCPECSIPYDILEELTK